MDEKGVFNIGQRNCLAMRKILWKAGVIVQAEETGGKTARTMRLEMESWMAEHEYTSVESMRGCMNILRAPNPNVFSRANYMRILQTWVKE